jgi:polysaccharide export outer membrane protein
VRGFSLVLIAVLIVLTGSVGCVSRPAASAPGDASVATEHPGPAAPPAAATGPRLYRIGPKDVLAIQVYRREDLTKQTPVRDDGTVFLPLAGHVDAAGKTVGELAAEIAARLAAYVREPQVDVIVVEYRARQYALLGEVREPGSYAIQADTRLLDAFGAGHGLTEKANLHDSYLVRGGTILPLDFEALFNRGDAAQNVFLESGDFVYVASRERMRVYVLGEVNQPQIVPMTEGKLTIPEAIAAAGGFNETTAFKSNLKIIRGGIAAPTVLTVNFEDFLHGRAGRAVDLEAGDIVFVPASGVTKWNRLLGQILPNLSQILIDAAAIGTLAR